MLMAIGKNNIAYTDTHSYRSYIIIWMYVKTLSKTPFRRVL